MVFYTANIVTSLVLIIVFEYHQELYPLMMLCLSIYAVTTYLIFDEEEFLEWRGGVISLSHHMKQKSGVTKPTRQANKEITIIQNNLVEKYDATMRNVIKEMAIVDTEGVLEKLRIRTIYLLGQAGQEAVVDIANIWIKANNEINNLSHLSYEEKQRRLKDVEQRVINSINLLGP